jgi:NADP-dependent 3-hydroxy acid dehydrogenase YdfG
MTLKSVLITGTSSGIGEVAAQYFLQWGAHVPLDAGSP